MAKAIKKTRPPVKKKAIAPQDNLLSIETLRASQKPKLITEKMAAKLKKESDVNQFLQAIVDHLARMTVQMNLIVWKLERMQEPCDSRSDESNDSAGIPICPTLPMDSRKEKP